MAGAALLVALRDGLVTVNVNAYYQSMVVGVVLFAAVVLDALRTRSRKRSGARAGLEAGREAGGGLAGLLRGGRR